MLKSNRPIYINVRNNTGSTQQVSIFNNVGSNFSGLSTQNSPISGSQFAYDMTAELSQFPRLLTYLVVIARPLTGSGGPFTMFVAQSGTQIMNITQVLNLANTLGLGTFYNPSGNIIAINSSTYYFSSFNLTDQVQPGVSTPSINYCTFGSLVYSPGYTNAGAGTITLINNTVPFWINGVPNTTNGPLNRTGIFNGIFTPGYYYNAFANIYLNSASTVYVGLSADYLPRCYCNGTLICNFDQATVQANVVAQLGGGYAGCLIYQFWHILPVQMQAGWNIVQMQGDNTGAHLQGSLGFEVYNNTAAQIEASTGYGGLNLLYTSTSYIGDEMF